MKILGIETSADDTGVALLQAEGTLGTDFSFRILGNALSSQTAIHTTYGGIFPAIAKREHTKALPLMLEECLKQAGEKHADAIAVTVGPGLEPCLWTGITCAQKLASEWRVPVIAANHMEGHTIISMVGGNVQFPALALLISGGHTELILMKEFMRYEYLGRTRDDAAGEAFDKTARLIGLPYPGGPEISRLAADARVTSQEPRIKFTSPMLRSDNFDFSFSGLKTDVRRFVEKNSPLSDEIKKEIALAVENAITDVLVAKTLRAAEERGAQTVVVGGGVSANAYIRSELSSKLQAIGCELLLPPPALSTDNAVMIALAGYFHAIKKDFVDPAILKADGNLRLA